METKFAWVGGFFAFFVPRKHCLNIKTKSANFFFWQIPQNWYNINNSGYGSSGRAPALGAGGFRFKSGCPDFFMMKQLPPFRQNAFNFSHTPSDVERTAVVDGIKTDLSFPVRPAFPFSSLVLSANFSAQDDGCLLLETQVFRGGEWSGFYKLGLLSAQFKRSFPPQEDTFGRVAMDELCLSVPAEAYRFRLKSSGDVSLNGLWACGVRAPFAYDVKSASRLPSGSFCASVEPVSQMEQKHPDKRRICSPVSVSMALNALGYQTPLEPFLQNVFDQSAAIYGNWTFSAAAAGMRGAQSFVRRFSALEELQDFVTPDSFVVASVSYGKGQLDGAPMESTTGHLVLVRGWEKQKVLVADPAAATKETVLRAYDARQFADAWLLNKKGAAYIVRRK